MRIFLVTSKIDLETGGGSNSDLDLKARAFMDLGDEVSVVTTFSEGNKIPFSPPYRIIEEHVRSRSLLGIQWGAFHIFRKYASEADIYYFDGHNFLYGAGWYRITGGIVPMVSFFNRELGSWPDNAKRYIKTKKSGILGHIKNNIRFFLEKYIGMRIASAIDLHTFTSPQYRSMYESFGLRIYRKPLIVGDLFDSEAIIKKYAVLRTVIPMRERHTGPFRLFYSGRLVPMRSVDLLLKAFSEIRNKKQYQLIIAGTGPEERELKKLCARLDIATSVTFTGWTSRGEIYQRLISSDLFVMPKGTYGVTSVSLLEAMAFGLPSLVPQGGGLEWVCGKAALTFEANNYADMRAQIERLAKEKDLRKVLTKACFTRLRELDYVKIARQIETAMQNLIREVKKN